MNSFEVAIENIIEQAGFKGAKRIKLMEDASTRTYERLVLGDKTAILMKAPAGNENPPCPIDADENERNLLGWNAQSRLAASRVEAFVAIGEYLRMLGFSTPEIYSSDVYEGLAVIEDLGNVLFAEILKDQPNTKQECDYYKIAAEVLAKLHEIKPPKTLPAPQGVWPILEFDKLALRVNADLFIDWVPKFLGKDEFSKDIHDEWFALTEEIIDEILTHPRAITLRDYHAENILWLEGREGLARIGLLDFQDAVYGFKAWDFTMLLHDARRDVSQDAFIVTIDTYIAKTGVSKDEFIHQLELQGAINIMRIIGIFSRLIKRDGKNKYREFMPRMIDHLLSVLGNKKLARLKAWIEKYAPLEELRQA